MYGSDDRDRHAQLPGDGHGDTHRGDVRFDGADPGGDGTGFCQRGAERRAVQVEDLTDRPDVANRPRALGGGDVRAGLAVADCEVRRFAGALGETIEERLSGDGEPVEPLAAASEAAMRRIVGPAEKLPPLSRST